tara:strand:- start:319 stop:1194 length:876 start_codon:yes stop_codon:yes gene_type:complete
MKKFKILIPVYNDWESLIKLLDEINKEIQNIEKAEFHCVVINDASTVKPPKIEIPINIRTLQIINMKENRGHARCNAFGIRHLSKDSNFDHLIVMDGDGEDRPEEIKILVEKVFSSENVSVVAKRIKRSEGFLFQMLYQIHKIITLIFTGKNINFGNYSCLTKNDVKILSKKESLWSSFSGSVKKHIPKLNTVNSVRGLRYFGPSQMSLLNLGLHSLSIIAVFKLSVFARTIIFGTVIYIFRNQIGSLLFTTAMVFLIVFSCLIYLVSFREDIKDFLNSGDNVDSTKNYTH